MLKPQHLSPRRVRVLQGKGHVAVRLYRPGLQKGKDIGVHRLVLTAFVGPCPKGMEGCHDDGDPLNNELRNLRWDTPRGNSQDRLKHGTDIRGEKHPRVILTAEQVLAIRERRKSRKETVKQIAMSYGVARTTISAIVNGASWRHLESGGGLSQP